MQVNLEIEQKQILDKISRDIALNVLDKFCIFLCCCKQNECTWYCEGWVMHKLSAIKTYLEITNPSWVKGDNNDQYAKICVMGENIFGIVTMRQALLLSQNL